MNILDILFSPSSVQAALDPARSLCEIEGIVVGIFGKVWPVIGTALLVMYIYGGAMWMMSSGDPQRLQKARGTITWATVGVCILALIMFIMGEFGRIFGVDIGLLTGFKICR